MKNQPCSFPSKLILQTTTEVIGKYVLYLIKINKSINVIM